MELFKDAPLRSSIILVLKPFHVFRFPFDTMACITKKNIIYLLQIKLAAMNDYNPNKKDYNPEMHSAEHILNQTMVRMFNRGRSFSAHIEKKKSKCDYRFDRNLSAEEITEIETRINNVIKQNMPVTEEIVSKEEADKIVNLAKLPEDAGERIRLIRIGDYDVCPCSGVHVANTSEIGEFKIISTDFNNGILRVRFKLQ